MRFAAVTCGVVAVFGVACLALSGSQSARAQVKLEYKFPEGKTFTYKTNWNPSQTLNLKGQEIQSRERKTVVWTQADRQAAGRFDPAGRCEGRIAAIGPPPSGRHRPDFRLEQARRQVRRLGFRPPGAISTSWRARSPTRSCSTARTRSRRSRGPRSSRRRRASSTPSRGSRSAAGSRPTGSRPSSSRSTGICPMDRSSPASRGSGPRSWNTAARRSVFRKKYEYTGTEKRGDKTLDKITSKVLEVKCPPQDAKTPSPLKVTKSDLKVESSEGTILFDREAGCLVESRDQIKSRGT